MSQARESITAALIIVRSSRRIGYSVDGRNWVRKTTQRSSTGSIQNAVDAAPPHQNSPSEPATCVLADVGGHREAQAEADAAVGGLGEHRQRHVGQVLAAGQVVGAHQRQRLRAEQARAVQFAAAAQAFAEAQVVGGGRHQPAAARRRRGGSRKLPSCAGASLPSGDIR